jgi:hypothetical protein
MLAGERAERLADSEVVVADGTRHRALGEMQKQRLVARLAGQQRQLVIEQASGAVLARLSIQRTQLLLEHLGLAVSGRIQGRVDAHDRRDRRMQPLIVQVRPIDALKPWKGS